MTPQDTPVLPDGPRGRALAGGLTVLALAAVWIAIILPLWNGYADRQQTIADRATMLAHMQAIRAALPDLSRRVREAAARAQGTTVLLQATTDAVAGAQLQQLVEGLLKNHGLSPTEEELMPGQPSGQLRRIGMHLKFQGQWSDLVAVLRDLEASRPRLFADDLRIQAIEAPDRQKGDMVETGLNVMGFRSAETTGTAKLPQPPHSGDTDRNSAPGASDGDTQ